MNEPEDKPGSPFKALAFGFCFAVILWLPIMELLVGCKSTSPHTRIVEAALVATDDANIPQGPLTQNGRARIWWPPPPAIATCRPRSGVNPWIHLQDQRPRVGGTIHCHIWSSFVGPPQPTVFLVVLSTRLLPDNGLDLTTYGAPGCRLLVPLDATFVVVPGGQTGPFRSLYDGRIDFEMPILPSHAGRRLYLQAGVLMPGENAAGLLTTPAVEWWIPG